MSQLLQANLLNSSGLKRNSAVFDINRPSGHKFVSIQANPRLTDVETMSFSNQDIVSEAIATTYISFQSPGTVMWEGQSWQAYCEENISIRQGQSVVVLARYGRSLLVHPE